MTGLAGVPGLAPFGDAAAAWMRRVHDDITTTLVDLDGGSVPLREDAWDRPGGGGGVARVLVEGDVFEKAGVNWSCVHGAMPASHAQRIGARVPASAELRFTATGVSLVWHPRSPRVPTVHLNVRFFEIGLEDGTVLDQWFGGGTDLTPFHPHPDDPRHFHRALRDLCAAHHPQFYPRFKLWCDEYFVNVHRNNERRGAGGIFFDNLRVGDPSGLDFAALRAFTDAVGHALPAAYGPIVARRRDEPYDDADRRRQLLRRGRYVEFNLVHDRGTVFGLQTNARIESVLMSLPPLARWEYDPVVAPGSADAELQAMLEPRDWADE
ncbi:MAG: oxygen-dependent coproporphyrinogen oxidase [Gemmatimonadales bacterium]|nr:oxygen-dependent coproporphyrinogen oxidase [Gemmatimonadales bacterium]